MLCFFVARQAERERCETFRAEIEEKLGEPVGGAKYVSPLADDGALAKERMIDAVLSPSSPFVGEGAAPEPGFSRRRKTWKRNRGRRRTGRGRR